MGFVIFLTSKLITCFIDGFILILKSQSIAYLLNGNEDIYWILDLEGEVHSIRDLWISGLQECKGVGYFKVKHAGQSLMLGPKNQDFSMGGYPCLNLSSLKSSWGGVGGV